MKSSEATVADLLKPLFVSFGWDEAALRVDFWDDSTFGNSDAKSTVSINSPEALRHIIWRPGELGLARAFVLGQIDLGGDVYNGLRSIVKIEPSFRRVGIRTLADSLRSAKQFGVLGKRPMAPPEEIVPKGKVHSRERDSQSVSHHYDVGNDFYRLVLGPSMVYSCARYTQEDETLEEAQANKCDLVSRKLGLSEGMRLLDVGCGWGTMVIHAAKHYGVSAVGITLSKEQANLARERVRNEGLSDKIEIRVQDYRDLNEEFDAISSIGMFEHVGKRQMLEYFRVLYRALKPGGRLLNHAIDKPTGSAMASDGFVFRYVFPDGELQDISTSIDAMQENGFEVRDVETLREHYAKTLQTWVTNLEANWEEAAALVGSNRARIWWLYMLGSALAFEDNRISIHQTLCTKTPENGASGMPLTRHSFV